MTRVGLLFEMVGIKCFTWFIFYPELLDPSVSLNDWFY